MDCIRLRQTRRGFSTILASKESALIHMQLDMVSQLEEYAITTVTHKNKGCVSYLTWPRDREKMDQQETVIIELLVFRGLYAIYITDDS